MKFLKLDEYITETFETEEIIPSAGQGIIAIQCRENDDEVISILKRLITIKPTEGHILSEMF